MFFGGKMTVCALVLVVCAETRSLGRRVERSPEPLKTGSRIVFVAGQEDVEGSIPREDDPMVASAQTQHGGQRAERRGYSGTVQDGKSRYISRYNHGVPVYGVGEPYYFSYTHNFPIGTEDFESLVNSHNLPKKYKFSGGLDVTGLLE